MARALWRVFYCAAAVISSVFGNIAAAQMSVTAPAGTGTAASSAAPASPGGTDPLPSTNKYEREYFTSDLKEVFRLRHIEGDGPGGVDAYTNFGFTKFMWGDNGVLMLDLGGRVTNEADPGVTGGIHRRTVHGDVMFGAGLFYDWQDFHQGSVAFEAFSPHWAFRTNAYAIFGDDVERESDYATTGATNIYFQGYNLLADGLALDEEYEVAMSGTDFEVARFIGSGIIELFVGGYYYDGDIGDDALGAKGGIRGFLVPDVAATLAVSGDDLFGTNIYGGITWFVGARGGLSRPNIARRLLIPVERNEQIVVNEVRRRVDVVGPVVLRHDDDEIEILHVSQGAAGANDGSYENPYNALPPTEEADIVYVYADGVFAGQSYTLAEDQRLLGEGDGNVHFVETDELGFIVLPAGNGGVNRPVIQASAGNAITIAAQDSEVSNFTIENATGHGIFGDGITDFNINRNVITGSAGRGIFLNNVSGAVDGEPIAAGEITGNVVENSTLQNIQIVLAGDFEGEIEGNTTTGSVTSSGIDISGPFVFTGEVSTNIANDNFTDGIAMDVEVFVGDVEGNMANNNQGDGFLLTFGQFDGDVENNTAINNGDNGIDFSLTGDAFSDVELAFNTLEDNGTEGMYLLFSGRGTARVEVLNNTFANNNGGTSREFFAENEDLPGNEPTTYIDFEGNTSANTVAAGGFNYEFDNNDLFADGEMYLDADFNVGTIEDDEDVEPGQFPW